MLIRTYLHIFYSSVEIQLLVNKCVYLAWKTSSLAVKLASVNLQYYCVPTYTDWTNGMYKLWSYESPILFRLQIIIWKIFLWLVYFLFLAFFLLLVVSFENCKQHLLAKRVCVLWMLNFMYYESHLLNFVFIFIFFYSSPYTIILPLADECSRCLFIQVVHLHSSFAFSFQIFFSVYYWIRHWPLWLCNILLIN